jgi:hypothetical protein
MRLRLLVTVSAIALASAACTSATDGPRPASEAVPSESVLLSSAGGPLLVEVPAGSMLFDGQGATASLGGRWVLSSSVTEDATVLQTLDAAAGEVVSTAEVPGELEVRLISESGHAVALMEPLPPGWDPVVPLPRSSTRIVVADPTGVSEPGTFDLRGNFEPEAFSTDDRSLFLIQHLPAETPRSYRVTVLDLDRGKVKPVFGPFKGPAERMPGIRLQQTLAPDASRLYTLYSSARPGYTPHAPSTHDGRIVAFVHVLSLREGWAHCVGLPKELWNRPAAEQAMAPSPDGDQLYVVDAALGTLAVMDTETFAVRSGEIDLHVAEPLRTSAQISAGGRTLYVATSRDDGSSVTAIDVRTFEVLDRWDVEGEVTGLGLSADGERLYAATVEDLEVLDLTTGSEVAEVAIRTSEPVTRVIPLAW